MKNTAKILENKDLRITLNLQELHENPEESYSRMWDMLGEMDVVQITERHPDYAACEDNFYRFDMSLIKSLLETGEVVVPFENSIFDDIDVHNEKDLEFLCWFYGKEDPADAVKDMYEVAGWSCTDIDTLQFMKVI